jgi:hypothetical protein
VIVPLRTAATTAALRRIVHLVVLGGGRSSIGGARGADCSMMLFSRFCEDLGRGQKDCSLLAIFVREIGLLPLHNSKCGHSRLIVALTHNFGPTASKKIRLISRAQLSSRYREKIRNELYC